MGSAKEMNPAKPEHDQIILSPHLIGGSFAGVCLSRFPTLLTAYHILIKSVFYDVSIQSIFNKNMFFKIFSIKSLIKCFFKNTI